MSNNEKLDCTPGRYGYYLTKDAHDDFFIIEDTRDGTLVMAIYFIEENNEMADAERKAQCIVATLNMAGGWIDIPLSSPPRLPPDK